MWLHKALLICILFVVLAGVAYANPAINISASPGVFNSTTGTDIQYNLTGAGNLTESMSVYDWNGTLVNSVDKGVHTSGNYSQHWPGDYGNGTSVPDGYYTISAAIALDHYKMTSKAGNTNRSTLKEFYPTCIGVNSSGYIFVGDMADQSQQMTPVWTNNTLSYIPNPYWTPDAIFVFAPDGSFIKTFGVFGKNYSQIGVPYCIAFNSSDYIFVASGGIISIFYPDYRFFGEFDHSDVPGVWNPGGFAFNSSGYVYVLNNWSVDIFSPDYRYLGSWGSYGNGSGQFNGYTSIAIDPSDNIYTCELENNRVEKFDYSGRLLKQWGSFGTGVGHFYYPMSIAVDNSSMVYVPDIILSGTGLLQCRTQVFDSEGNFLRVFNTTGPYYESWFDSSSCSMRWIAVDHTTGHILVSDMGGGFGMGDSIYDSLAAFTGSYGPRVDITDSYGNQVLAIWGTGSSHGDLYQVSDAAVNASGYTYAICKSDDKVQVFSPDGNFSFAWQYQFQYPSSIAINSSGYVYVADSNQLVVFDRSGGFVAKYQIINPLVRIFLDVWQNVLSFISQAMNPLSGGSTVSQDFLSPALQTKLAIGPGDNLYVTSNLGWDKIRVFSPNGTFLGGIAPFAPGAMLNQSMVNDLKINQSLLDQINGTGAINDSEGMSTINVLDMYAGMYSMLDSIGYASGVNDTLVNMDGVPVLDHLYYDGIAVNSTGYIYVTAPSNNCVKIYPPAQLSSDLPDYLTQNNTIILNITGDGFGGFNRPTDIAINSSDYVFILDSGNNRTVILDPNNDFLMQLGTVGIGDGQFLNPQGLGIDPSGNNLVVADTGNNRTETFQDFVADSVQVLVDNTPPVVAASANVSANAAGWYTSDILVTLTPSDSGSGVSASWYSLDNKSWNAYVGPFALSTDGINTIYWKCLDNAGNIGLGSQDFKIITHLPVVSFSANATGGAPPLTVQFTDNSSLYPYAWAWDFGEHAQCVYVADTLHNVIDRVYANGSVETLAGGFNDPAGVAVDSRGNVYVADSANNVIKEILANGTVVTIGGGFNFPRGIAVDSHGNVYVADMDNNAVKEIYANGTIVTLASGFNYPSGVAVDSQGNVFVMDTNNGAIKKICAGNNTVVTLIIDFYSPYGIAIDAGGDLYVADSGSGSVKELYVNGTIAILGNNSVFGDPRGIAVDSRGNVYVTDINNNLIKKISTDGTISTLAGGFLWPMGIAVAPPDSLEQNPVHKYNSPGAYNVSLTAWNWFGPNTSVATGYIEVYTVKPDFTANVTSGDAPLTVQFTDKSLGGASSWDWSFGDGSANSSEQNPTHTFPGNGTYTVTLTASGVNGTGTASKLITVGSEPVPPVYPVANFYSDSMGGDAPLTVNFTDTSSGNPTSWEWNFGDGSANSTERNPVHTFNTRGSYAVTLTVTNSNGSSTGLGWYPIAVFAKPISDVLVSLPSSANVSGVDVNISGGNVSASGNLSGITNNGSLVMPIDLGGSGNASLNLTLGDVNGANASISGIVLNVTQNYSLNGSSASLQLSANLYDIPQYASLYISVLPPDSVNMSAVNSILNNSSLRPGTMLAVIDVDKMNLVNGVDVGSVTFTITMPMPDGFNASAPYYVVRQSDGVNEVLTATVISIDGNNVTFQVVSPHGLSTFTFLEGQSQASSFTLSLKNGWNLVSSPLVISPAVNVSAFKGTNVTMVARYNKTTGGFDIYRVGKTPTAFPFIEGQGYFLYCDNDTEYTINGISEPNQSATISMGWNLVGWTNMTSTTSKVLAEGLQNVTMLARYNTTSGGYDIYRVGKTPTPFDIKAGEGYFLYTTYVSPQTLLMA